MVAERDYEMPCLCTDLVVNASSGPAVRPDELIATRR